MNATRNGNTVRISVDFKFILTTTIAIAAHGIFLAWIGSQYITELDGRVVANTTELHRRNKIIEELATHFTAGAVQEARFDERMKSIDVRLNRLDEIIDKVKATQNGR